jgi:hypothetical protein
MTEKDLNRMRGTGARGTHDLGGVVYHDTRIVCWGPQDIILDNGGWFTPTTQRRMNQAAEAYGLGFHVYQDKGEWFADYRGKALKFEGRTLTITREG